MVTDKPMYFLLRFHYTVNKIFEISVSPVQLRVMKNGERCADSAVTVVGPNLTNVSAWHLISTCWKYQFISIFQHHITGHASRPKL